MGILNRIGLYTKSDIEAALEADRKATNKYNEARREWLYRTHKVVNCNGSTAFNFNVVRDEPISERAKRTILEHDLDVGFNTKATEPRWEAFNYQHIGGFGDSVDEAVQNWAESLASLK